MKHDRIYFKGNPWPEGHPVKKFVWSAKEIDRQVWFDMHLESANYYAERDIENNEDIDCPSDWASPIVWSNYHSCTLSSSYWHDGGFKVCAIEDYIPERLDGLELTVDPDPKSMDDWEQLAFGIYLLGHDAVAKHKIRFERIGQSMKFRINWTGFIAQAYVGNYEFQHEFATAISSIAFPQLSSRTE